MGNSDMSEGLATTGFTLWGLDQRAWVLAGATLVVVIMLIIVRGILTSRRLENSSLFNRLFLVVAVTSAFFSAVSSAIGFAIITAQESFDLFRNAVLPPAFGVFVFFVTVAIWVGGAELVRNRDWFRGAAGFGGDVLFFIERALKLFVVIPILALILFMVSTWTSVVGIAGVDAVRHTYSYELDRLQTDCNGIVSYRRNDLLFLDDLRLAIGDARRVATRERNTGGQTGLRGPGAASDYFTGVADWLTALEASADNIIAAQRPSEDPSIQLSVFDETVCGRIGDDLNAKLSEDAFANIDLWTRDLQNHYDNVALTLNRWRLDRRLLTLIEQQVNNFERANPKPVGDPTSRTGELQNEAIDQYAGNVERALKSLVRRLKARKPPPPTPSAEELSPARGFEIISGIWESLVPSADDEVSLSDEETSPPRRRSRSQTVVEQERIPGLSVITPRDAVLKNFQIFSDVWALALSWDFASYILLLAYLFFPSAERRAGRKDDVV